MKKSEFLNNLQKIMEKRKIVDKDNLEKIGMDSLKILELMVFNDNNFKKINISPEKISNCKTVRDLIKLYGKEIN